jgi:hypothetical protein
VNLEEAKKKAADLIAKGDVQNAAVEQTGSGYEVVVKRPMGEDVGRAGNFEKKA